MELFFVIAILLLAAGVGALLGYIIIDKTRHDKIRIEKELTKIGASNIYISIAFDRLSIPFGDSRVASAYHVHYHDSQGKEHRTSCWFLPYVTEIQWKDKP